MTHCPFSENSEVGANCTVGGVRPIASEADSCPDGENLGKRYDNGPARTAVHDIKATSPHSPFDFGASRGGGLYAADGDLCFGFPHGRTPKSIGLAMDKDRPVIRSGFQNRTGWRPSHCSQVLQTRLYRYNLQMQ
jgi:hypothetical protein